MHALKKEVTIPVYAFASPVYWSDPAELAAMYDLLVTSLKDAWPDIPAERLSFRLIDSDATVEKALATAESELAFFIPMSGGVQPWILRLSEQYQHIALVNAYLPDTLPFRLTDKLMHLNAHPSCTDFYANQRMAGKSIHWMRSVRHGVPLWRAWRAVQRLRTARLLKIGETEPWVINSCRSPERIQEKLGTQVIPLPLEALYEQVTAVSEDDIDERADAWVTGATEMVGVIDRDVAKACKVVIAMERLLQAHRADGLSMACFSMIQELDTTSCLALSMLNEATDTIGACEGDLDAALTLYLLKALGADFVWIANPIIYDAPYIDLAHCTAPRCACNTMLNYKLMRHHESGRGVAPEVVLPSGEEVSLVRLGNNLNDMALHFGTTEQQPKMHTCHTQIRVHLPSSQHVLDTLLGTHMVMSYGDYRAEMGYVTKFLGLRLLAPGC